MLFSKARNRHLAICVYPVAYRLVSTLSSTVESLLSVPVLCCRVCVMLRKKGLGLEGGVQLKGRSPSSTSNSVVDELSHPLTLSLRGLSLSSQ